MKKINYKEKLELLRKNIAMVDKAIANYFEKRMGFAKKIAKIKKENNLKIYDAKQEAKVIKRNLSYIKDKDLKKYYKELLTTMLAVSKKYQKEQNEK